MSTLLILGSKPDPVLPPRSDYDHLACANASGFSAAKRGLPVPAYTVMSAILTHRESGKQSLRVLSGLQTDILYFLPRSEKKRNPLKMAMYHLKALHMKPFYLKWKLWFLAYKYEIFVNKNHSYYEKLVKELCDYNEQILELIQQKRPSTGIFALMIGIAQQRYDRFIMSGFSFELTHAYAINPEIHESGTTVSKHADTDIIILSYLSRKYNNIYTTEKIVNERTAVPLLRED
jgi:hypothetical protein